MGNFSINLPDLAVRTCIRTAAQNVSGEGMASVGGDVAGDDRNGVEAGDKDAGRVARILIYCEDVLASTE